MIFEKFINNDLGHVSYLFGDESSKEIAIVDPQRDCDEYIHYIDQFDLKLIFIINSHTHADYIGGHLELKNKYPNAQNIFQHNVPAGFDFLKVKNSDFFSLGHSLSIKILETPGHTPFCICCLISEDGIEKYIFTGDIILIGDIARPDLLGENNLELLLNNSFDSAVKLYNLDDDLIIFTSHIKGSFCGKNLKSQYFSTIGIEKKSNTSFMLCNKSKKLYMDNLRNQNIHTPKFFKTLASINISAPTLIKNMPIIHKLSYEEYSNLTLTNSYIIDIRDDKKFSINHLDNSINIYEKSNISLIAGSLLDNVKNVYLLGDTSSNFDDVVNRLRRVGFDHIVGILYFDIYIMQPLSPIQTITNHDVTIDLETLHISNIPNYNFDKNKTYKINCQNGHKSSCVVSFMKHNGYDNIY
jgi:glyoxylase-like metal-dependent hydrolase (beta-lactamase superfamily II)/rhodanese-related sulfurtransferase